MFSTYKELAAHMAVELVNTFNPVDGEDNLQTVADLSEFLTEQQEDWPKEDWHPGRPNKAELAAVLELRASLRDVFAAETPDKAARILNGILADSKAAPRINAHSDHVELRYEPESGGTAAWLSATTAMGLGVLLCDFGLERFGACSSHDCVDVFVDGSKNRSRRHCSTKCATRDNVAALRRRQRATAQSSSP